MKERTANSKKSLLPVLLIIAVMLIGSASAYFTDTDKAENSFTVGNIDISAHEPGWNSENGKDITPGKNVKKDPYISNDGANDAYVFMKVTVPAAEVMTSNEDGSLNQKAKHELFTYAVNSGWTLVDKTDTDNAVTYIYGYTTDDGKMKVLSPGSITGTLFDSVTFINIIEGQLEGQSLSLNVEAIGIQSDDIGKTSPDEVYSIITGRG